MRSSRVDASTGPKSINKDNKDTNQLWKENIASNHITFQTECNVLYIFCEVHSRCQQGYDY